MPMGENNPKLCRVHVTLKRNISGGSFKVKAYHKFLTGQKTFIYHDSVTSSSLSL